MSDSLCPHQLQPTRLLCPRDFPGKNTGVGCHALLQGIFLTQELNPHLLNLLHWQADSLPLSHQGSPVSSLDHWFSGWWGVFAAFHKCLCLNRALWNISLSSCSDCKYCPASSFPWCVLGSSMLPSWEYGAWNVDTYKCCWMNRLMSGCWVSRSFKSLNLAMLLTSFVSSDNSLSLSEPHFPNL